MRNLISQIFTAKKLSFCRTVRFLLDLRLHDFHLIVELTRIYVHIVAIVVFFVDFDSNSTLELTQVFFPETFYIRHSALTK